MKGDHEYAEVVTRLWMRNCTLDDVDLFNSTIIQSAEHENGINMSEPYENDATSMVDSNISWEILNLWKAQSNCVQLGQTLVMSAAVDKSISGKITESEQHQLLNMDISSSKLKQTPPGFIPLYIGMPIVLYIKNTSTELGIANGTQGVLKKFYTEVNSAGLTYCKCAIVEFMKSRIELPGLKKGEFPILPIFVMFSTQLPDENNCVKKVKITWTQLPFQPAFSLTGHSAQGKTLPKIVTGMHKGGFSAYVAASRAQTWKGLCITHAVTLQDLNKPLPHTLITESQQLDVIEHNTLILHSFKPGFLKSIPDIESEYTVKTKTFSAKFHTSLNLNKIICKDTNKSKKQKLNDDPTFDTCFSNNKQQHTFANDLNINNNTTGGCTWCAEDWSCAYGTTIMILYYIFLWTRFWETNYVVTSIRYSLQFSSIISKCWLLLVICWSLKFLFSNS